MTIDNGVHSNYVHIAGALQIYGQTSLQRLSAQCPSRHIDKQSWSLMLSGSLGGYQFSNPSVLLSDVQVNVPSKDRSFPPIQYSQQYHQFGEHKADRKKIIYTYICTPRQNNFIHSDCRKKTPELKTPGEMLFSFARTWLK